MASCGFFYFIKTGIIMTVVFYHVCHCEDRSSYIKTRQKFLKTESSWRTGEILYLSDKELKVNQTVMSWKLAEINQGFAAGSFPPSTHFFQAKALIENSTIFKILQKMPKGAALHLHDSSLVDVWWLVKNATYMDHCYMCVDKKGQLQFKFSKSTPKSDKCKWLLVSDVRKQYDQHTFDQWLYNNMSLIVSDPATAYPKPKTAWKKFSSLFKAADGLIFYKPVFEAYFREALREFYEDNVQYFEFRALLTDVTDIAGNQYDREWMIGTYKKISEEFMQKYPDFTGTKMIYSTSRSSSKREVASTVNDSLKFQMEFPGYFVGFDLVGQEDSGHDLLYFLDELLYPSQHNMSLKYFFHAGETDWLGSGIDENLIDAILLNATRIGHGYAITKHPLVMKYVKQKDIAIEVCPISNQVLKLVDDLRNHPASSLLMQNYPVVISADDPGLWGARGLSYDFYEAFMGLGGDKADLGFLKQLAMNSISYSAMTTSEKEKTMRIWIEKWNQFLDYVLENF